MKSSLFSSFLLGGFECSCHYNQAQRRLDVLGATQHDRFARQDYAALQQHGLFTVRDGIRWPLIETRPGHYDFSSVRPMIQAAHETRTQVIWDLCHFGWPDDVDVFRPEFVTRFARLAQSFAQLLTDETDLTPFVVPINEISFTAWAFGENGTFSSPQTRRGFEMKAQLVRATIEAIERMWEVNPLIRIALVDPAFYTIAQPDRPEDQEEAERYRLAQYESWDMLAGQLWPQLGGDLKYLDVVGVNYYPYNQWYYHSAEIPQTHPDYRPFRQILSEVYERYQRPMFIAETGAEGELRVPWLQYVGEETRAALQAGISIEGVCLYPITDYPGWNDDRHCPTGLLGYSDDRGERLVYQPLAEELARQRKLFDALETLQSSESAVL